MMFCNVGAAKDLTGTKLLCKRNYKVSGTGIWFINDSEVRMIYISGWEVENKKMNYTVEPHYIWLGGMGGINREALVYTGRVSSDCSFMEKDFDYYGYFHNILTDRIKEQESKNKL